MLNMSELSDKSKHTIKLLTFIITSPSRQFVYTVDMTSHVVGVALSTRQPRHRPLLLECRSSGRGASPPIGSILRTQLCLSVHNAQPHIISTIKSQIPNILLPLNLVTWHTCKIYRCDFYFCHLKPHTNTRSMADPRVTKHPSLQQLRFFRHQTLIQQNFTLII